MAPVLAVDITALLLAFGSIIAGIGGIGTAIAAVMKARRETEDECDEHVKALRVEVEDASRRLHYWRMNHLDEKEPEDL